MSRGHDNVATACALTRGGGNDDHAPVSDDDRLTGYPDSLLKDEMLRAGLSIQGLAKLMSGANGNHAQRESARTSIRRWLRNPAMGITPTSSARLAPHFARPADHFVRPAQPRTRQADRLEALSAEVERQGKLLREMAKEIERLTSAQESARPQPRKRRRAGGAA
jgi:hypothetical protein